MISVVDYLNAGGRAELLASWADAEDPGSVSAGSNKKVMWRCKRGHEWRATVASRVLNGNNCPYCAGQRAISGENDLLTLRPDLALLWDTKKNGMDASSVMPNSHRTAWWRCEKGHSWESRIDAVTGGSRCPYCAGKKPIPGQSDLATTHPALAAEWDEEKNRINKRKHGISFACFERLGRCVCYCVVEMRQRT